MRSSIPTAKRSNIPSGFSKVAIPFKWGQVFQPLMGCHIDDIQIKVAIPFKWGQVFQLNMRKVTIEEAREVAIPFKWGQVFQH